MLKKPLFGRVGPGFPSAGVLGYAGETVGEVPVPDKLTLYLQPTAGAQDDSTLRVGDRVRKGQKLKLSDESEDYLISTVTGTISDVTVVNGYLGREHVALSIEKTDEGEGGDPFRAIAKTPSLANARDFMGCLPGAPEFASLLKRLPYLETIVIMGIDKDPMVTTNVGVLHDDLESLKAGVEYLRAIASQPRMLLLVPSSLTVRIGDLGIDLEVMEALYPDTLPPLIAKNLLGKVVPAGKQCEDVGVGFVTAEAVAAIGQAYKQGKTPADKMVTVIRKDLSTATVRVRVGTPVKDVLAHLDLETLHGDRLVLGGPMTGRAVFSEETPVLHDTDAIFLQDREQVHLEADCHCVNCGACVRACPARIPVNMLVRLLENGLYEEAATSYDLLSCLECGLCSYVCMSRIPIYHYIMLGKVELASAKSAEESNGEREAAH
jgi:electron transport complex protein RnfC